LLLGLGADLHVPALGPGSATAQRITLPSTSDPDGTTPALATATDRPCPESPVAAALDASTGQVWAYPARPAPGQEVRGEAVQRVPGAAGLEVRTEGTCERIVAVGPAGQAWILPGEAGSDRVRPG
jgi:hypothetical protein